jgi:iron complex outermembrane receptor protein
MARQRANASRNALKTFLMTGGAAIALGVSGAAFAQDDEDVTDEILVTGFRQSIETSTAIKRNSSSIVEAVTAEDIGKLPDVSIAESLARLPGLATQRLDGRSNVVTIRGLGPDFSTALLNGREQVSVNDNRGVEFDQYPSELLTGATVYKTPYAGLIGQGLAGTVDLRTIRPLDAGKRIIAGGGRYEFNENGSLNPDSPDWGWRGSLTIVDQFDSDRWGIALGVAYQSTPTQSERFNSWGFPTTGAGEAVIGGAKPFNQSNDLDRFGVVGIVEFEPTDYFRSAIDVYYSKFDETQRLRGIEFPLQWSAASLQPGYTIEDGLVTAGQFNNVKAVLRNDVNQRDANLFAGGWNGRFDNDVWGLEMDISYSRANRHDDLIESYSGTSYGGGNGPFDNLGFQLQDGFFRFTPTLDYSGATTPFVLTDPQGWGGGPGNVQAGFINSPDTEDELWHFKAQANKYIDGFFSNIVVGFDYAMREKVREIGQNFLNLPGGAQTAPIPASVILSEQAGMSWLGIPAQVTYDPLPLLEDGTYVFRPVGLSSFSVPQSWDISEDVTTAYARLDIESGALNGNIGVQVLHTDQESSGFRVDQGAATPTFIPFTDGDKYWDVLPSANFIFALGENTMLRMSAAKTLVRARMDKLNASLSLGEDITKLMSTDPLNSYFSASGGNPRLRPYTSWGFDVSLEHYFGGAGYFSIAGFYKDLNDYVFDNDGFVYDFAAFVDSSKLSAADKLLLGTTLGRISGPTNRGNGHIKGFEATLSVPLEAISEPLEGLGFITSVAFNDSEVILGTNPTPITVPGLSKWVVNSTVYFEKAGFEARVSHRYRGDFLAEVAAISATRDLRTADAESIIDAQIGYRFSSGALNGLSIYFQGNNLTDEPFITFDNGDIRFVRDYQSYGRTYAVGANFRF